VLQLQTANTTAVTITAAQNVGIGTASPSAFGAGYTSLTVQGSNSGFVQATNGTITTEVGTFGGIGYTGTRSSHAYGFVVGGSEKARFDTSGNLGLGLTPVGSWGTQAFMLAKTGASNPTYPFIASTDSQAVFIGSNSYWDGTNFKAQFGGAGVVAMHQKFNYNAITWHTAPAVSTGNTQTFTQAMTLDASGNLGIGSTSPSERLDVGGFVKSTGLTVSGTNVCTIASSNANSYILILSSTNATPLSEYIQSLRFTASAPNNTSARFLEGGDTGGDRFVFRSNGGLANYSANDVNLSDRREKINFAPAGSYLDKICAIPVQTFNYIDQNLEDDGGLTLGVVAQDVQAVAPELVMESDWAKKDEEPKMRLSIYQTDLQYALMKCIQEQQAIIETLKADVAALKGTV
jgi:hypothetical protein